MNKLEKAEKFRAMSCITPGVTQISANTVDMDDIVHIGLSRSNFNSFQIREEGRRILVEANKRDPIRKKRAMRHKRHSLQPPISKVPIDFKVRRNSE